VFGGVVGRNADGPRIVPDDDDFAEFAGTPERVQVPAEQ